MQAAGEEHNAWTRRMSGNGNGSGGNGNGKGRRPRVDDVPWEEVRSLTWEVMRTSSLCFDRGAAGMPCMWGGESYSTGFSFARMMVAIDLVKMLNRLGREIGTYRSDRFMDFVAGRPPNTFGRVEQVQLKADVRRLADLATAGGYGGWLSRGE